MKASVQRRARQVRDRGLKGVEAIVKRQECVLPKGYDGGLLLGCERAGTRLPGPHRCVVGERASTPLGDGFAINAVPGSQRRHGLLAALDGSADGLRRAGAAVK